MNTKLPARVVVPGLWAGLFLLAGCNGGGPSSGPQTDAQALGALVAGMPDLATNPPLAKTVFVEGAMPSKEVFKKMARYTFESTAPPNVTGAEATVRVAVRDGDRELGETEWAFVKGGDGWQVKSAPLP